jgi:hypothetical protein
VAYLSVAVEVDASAITQEKIDYLQGRVPGLVVVVGSTLYFLIEATSERDATNAQLITEVTDLVWDSFGAKILRLPREAATQADTTTTWTRVDVAEFPLSAPLTIPAGTGLSLAAADGTRVPFVTVNEVTMAGGVASTATGEVTILATTGGAAGTGLQADPQPDLTFTWLDTITVEAPTTGGEDEEDVDTYRNRLADEASLMARTLVLPDDFAIRARDEDGVGLALAIDLYNAATSTANQPGHITVAVRDPDGLDPGSTVRGTVLADLQADAVSILTIHVIAPTYTAITVVFNAVAYTGFDPADVQARAEQAVLDFLSPANWGLPPFGDQQVWLDKPIVRFRDIVTAIENTEGLDYTASVAGTATTTSGSPNLTVVTPTTGWKNGMAISGTGIPAGTRILSGAGTATMVMSANATASASGVAITGAAVTLNGATSDVTMTGPAALPAAPPATTVDGTVSAAP